MNIAVLSHRVPYPPIKGEKIRTYHQLESLRQADCQVTVFCPLHDADDAKLVRDYSAASGLEVRAEPAGKGWHRMVAALMSGRSLSVARFHVPALQRQLDQYLESARVDVLYCTSSAMAEYAIKAASRHPGLRIIVDFMDLDSDKWRRFSGISGFPMSLIYRYEAHALGRFERRVQSSVERCLFVSQAEVDLYHQENNSEAANLEVIGNGVEFDEYYPAADAGYRQPLNLLFTGVMDYLPNEDAICWFVDNVWHSVVAKFPDAQLTVAGMKPTQRVLNLERYGNITVTGFVEKMLPHYHDADIFIAPFQIARGVQNKILQAFACGLPVVTTPIGAEGIEGTDGEHFLIADSPAHFAEQIERLVGQPELFRRLSESARQLVTRDYLWEAKNRPLVSLVLAEDSA